MHKIEELKQILSAEFLSTQPHTKSITILPWFTAPSVGFSIYGTSNPVYTAIIPIFNQESILVQFLKNHLKNAIIPHSILAIFDSCTDKSRDAFWSFFRQTEVPLVASVTEIVTSVPYFETACDNIGFIASKTPYIIEYQPDLMIETFGYDERLLDTLKIESIFCVSGRCGHSLRTVFPRPNWPMSMSWRFAERNDRVGLFSSSIETKGMEVHDSGRTAYLCETVNRGPIAFRLDDLARLQYLDCENFFLGNDDHDINLREFLRSGRTPAYLPLKVWSRLDEGSTRKPRDPLNTKIYQYLKARPDRSTLTRFARFYKPYLSTRALDIPAGNG